MRTRYNIYSKGLMTRINSYFRRRSKRYLGENESRTISRFIQELVWGPQCSSISWGIILRGEQKATLKLFSDICLHETHATLTARANVLSREITASTPGNQASASEGLLPTVTVRRLCGRFSFEAEVRLSWAKGGNRTQTSSYYRQRETIKLLTECSWRFWTWRSVPLLHNIIHRHCSLTSEELLVNSSNDRGLKIAFFS